MAPKAHRDRSVPLESFLAKIEARGRREVIARIRVWQETNVVRREDRR